MLNTQPSNNSLSGRAWAWFVSLPVDPQLITTYQVRAPINSLALALSRTPGEVAPLGDIVRSWGELQTGLQAEAQKELDRSNAHDFIMRAWAWYLELPNSSKPLTALAIALSRLPADADISPYWEELQNALHVWSNACEGVEDVQG